MHFYFHDPDPEDRQNVLFSPVQNHPNQKKRERHTHTNTFIRPVFFLHFLFLFIVCLCALNHYKKNKPERNLKKNRFVSHWTRRSTNQKRVNKFLANSLSFLFFPRQSSIVIVISSVVLVKSQHVRAQSFERKSVKKNANSHRFSPLVSSRNTIHRISIRRRSRERNARRIVNLPFD